MTPSQTLSYTLQLAGGGSGGDNSGDPTWVDTGTLFVAAAALFVSSLVAIIVAFMSRTTAASTTKLAGDLQEQNTKLTGALQEQNTKLAGALQEQTAMLTSALQLQIEYSTGLHAERLMSYQKLYSILKPLALAARRAPDEDRCHELADEITGWYYDTGGLHVSDELRNAILELRHRLATYPDDAYNAESDDVQETMRASFEAAMDEFPLRRHASDLRTLITEEVFSRKGPPGPATPLNSQATQPNPNEQETHPDSDEDEDDD